MFAYLTWVKLLQKVDFGEIKCGKISDIIFPKSTFCKTHTNWVYKHSLFSSHAIYKKVLRFKKINAINRKIEVGNVGIGKIWCDTCP